jgi:hypothetical protein
VEQQRTTPASDLEMRIRDFLGAVQDQDLERCMEFYADDASVSMLHATHTGRESIEEWHRERIAAGLEIVKINQVKVKRDTAVVDAVITSKRLRSLRIPSLRGTGTFKTEDGLIKQVSFKPKMYNPLEAWGNR